MLWLEGEEDDCKDVCPGKKAIEQADANFVAMMLTDVVRDAYGNHDDEEDEDGQLMIGQGCVVEWKLEYAQLLEVADERCEVVPIGQPAGIKPVGCQQPKE